jgi:hypothetical protein
LHDFVPELQIYIYDQSPRHVCEQVPGREVLIGLMTDGG